MHKLDVPYDSTKETKPSGWAIASAAPPVDRVVTTVMLMAPAALKVVSGGNTYTHEAPAGVSTFWDPLFPDDQPKFSLERSGTTVIPQFSSAFKTRGSVVWRDWRYRMGSSSRPPVPASKTTFPKTVSSGNMNRETLHRAINRGDRECAKTRAAEGSASAAAH